MHFASSPPNHPLMSHFLFLQADESYIMISRDHFSEQVLCAQNLCCPLVNFIYPLRLMPLSQVAMVSYCKTQLCGYNILSILINKHRFLQSILEV